jgi:hypothetical protein
MEEELQVKTNLSQGRRASMKKLLTYGLVLLFGASVFWVYSAPARAEEMWGSTCPWNAAWGSGYDPSGLVGAMALSPDLDPLGRVVEVMDSPDGGIDFLVVSSCLPGTSGRLVAVPYKSSHDFGGQVDNVELPFSTEEFRDAPNYSRDSWSHNTNWAQNAYQYFEKIQ